MFKNEFATAASSAADSCAALAPVPGRLRNPEAERLVRIDQPPRDVLAALMAADMLGDAIRFLAMALPKRPSILWGALCVWEGYQGQPPVEAAAALEATCAWLRKPSESNRRTVEELGRAGPFPVAGRRPGPGRLHERRQHFAAAFAVCRPRSGRKRPTGSRCRHALGRAAPPLRVSRPLPTVSGHRPPGCRWRIGLARRAGRAGQHASRSAAIIGAGAAYLRGPHHCHAAVESSLAAAPNSMPRPKRKRSRVHKEQPR